MLIEQHPALHSLSVEDKLKLSEELCLDALLDAQQNPALLQRVQQRLQEFRESLITASHGMTSKEKFFPVRKLREGDHLSLHCLPVFGCIVPI